MANIVMEHVEETALQRTQHVPKFYRRYVDDTFVVLNQGHLNDFVSILNGVEPTIQFTQEVEQHGTLSFLDGSVRRWEDGTLQTSVHRKPCNKRNFLNFDSHHPLEQKRIVVRSHRSDKFASTAELLAAEEKTIADSLTKRGYPKSFIANTRRRMQEKRSHDKSNHSQGSVCIQDDFQTCHGTS
ncbi:uncharacterized protein LOC135394599 [Ornithodoros turicata]|uniref:uncharacterized protein LOC135394599 n=1 Tax=Ornithodoros turicata TaxID=34597 RepID=UPI003139A584